MIVDIGGGTTDIAVVSLAGIVYSRRSASPATRWTRRSPPYVKTRARSADRRAHRRAHQDGARFRGAARPKKEMEVKGRHVLEGRPATSSHRRRDSGSAGRAVSADRQAVATRSSAFHLNCPPTSRPRHRAERRRALLQRSTSACAAKPACPSGWPKTRSRPSCLAPARCSRILRCSGKSPETCPNMVMICESSIVNGRRFCARCQCQRRFFAPAAAQVLDRAIFRGTRCSTSGAKDGRR